MSKSAFGWMKKVAKDSFKDMRTAISQKYFNANNQNNDMTQGEQFFAAQDDPRSVHAVQLWQQGDYKTAFQLFQQIAANGDAEAFNNLAIMYDNGYGVPVNSQEAFRLFKLDADKNFEPTFALLARRYLYGFGTEPDLAQAKY